MEFFTRSHGIANNPQIRRLLKTNKVRLLSFLSSKAFARSSSILVGWGYKPNTIKTREVAQAHQLPYWAIEDGFISWLNHPSQSKSHQRLSYIVDTHGIYYDATQPSGLDVLLSESKSLDESRVFRLLTQLNNLKVSKYNQARSCQLESVLTVKNYLLLVDQTFGDASIEYSGGSEKSFDDMLDWTIEKLKEDQSLHCVVKLHPDVILGNKKGYLFDRINGLNLDEKLKDRLHLVSEDVLPFDLIRNAAEVAIVSSQLGFESLWQNKKVHCFAWPFYAGRGLTVDHASTPLSYSRKQVNLNQLIQSALIEYPTYLHPDNQEVCEVEEILDYLQAHFLTRELHVENLAIPNISLWKRSFIPEFISVSANHIRFGQPKDDETQLLWGMKKPDTNNERMTWRIEDGFVRSVGLGADLMRPSSLVIDDEGIYYNGKIKSRLESLLNNYQLNEYEKNRADKLIQLLRDSSITKYNVESKNDVNALKEQACRRKIVLVTGQFQQDLSMEFGATDINDNLTLLHKVREDYPEAFVIYKEHPDVYSGVRPGRLEESDVLELADVYVSDTSLISLFEVSDRLCTICSLSGFEALIRGLPVTTYGLPFYAGWGLTEDRQSFTRRTRQLDLSAMVYVTLVLYSRYVSWHTRDITTVESTIFQLMHARLQKMNLKSSWFGRQWRKFRYLTQALFKYQGMAGK